MVSNVQSTSASASAWMNGWIGRNPANVTIHQSGDQVTLSGNTSDASIHVTKMGTSLVGSVNSRRGSWPVSVWVNGPEGSRSFSGTVGREFVSVQETTQGDGVRLSGWVGSRFVNAAYESQNGWIRFDGQAGFGFEGRINLNGSQTPAEPRIQPDVLVPLLALAGG